MAEEEFETFEPPPLGIVLVMAQALARRQPLPPRDVLPDLSLGEAAVTFAAAAVALGGYYGKDLVYAPGPATPPHLATAVTDLLRAVEADDQPAIRATLDRPDDDVGHIAILTAKAVYELLTRAPRSMPRLVVPDALGEEA